MSRSGRFPTGAAPALLLVAGLLSPGSAGAADADAGRALMGLAEDRQRAQDAARVLDRLGAPASQRPPAAVAVTEPKAAPPTAKPAEAPVLPRPTQQATVEPGRKAASVGRPSSPSDAQREAPERPTEAAPGKPTIAALPPAAPSPPRIAQPAAPPDPAPKPAERETRQSAAPVKIPDRRPEPPPVMAILPPPRETAPAARPDDPVPPRRESPATVLAVRPVEEPVPVRPPVVAPIIASMPAAEVYFGYGSVTLSDESVAALLPLGEDRAGTGLVTIVGHADALEKDTLDRKFSERRADAVRRFLVAKLGFDPKRLVVRGVGAERPKVQGDLPSPQNRRVEILPAPVSPPSSGRTSPDRGR